jgi:hypothetical protein
MIAKQTGRWWRLAGALALMLGLAAAASGQPVISGSLPSTDVGATPLSYGSIQLVTGGTQPYTWTITGPILGWLNFNADGSVNANSPPSTAGTFNFNLQVTDSATLTSNVAPFSVIVNPAVQISIGATLPAGQQGVLYPVTTLGATGGTGTYTWSLAGGSLPPPLTLSATGSIGPGPPTAFGVFPFTAQVTDGLTTATQAFSITIAPPPLVVLTTTLPPGEASAPYTASPSATGGVPPYTWSITGLPAGLTFSSSTGVISGPLAASATTSTAVVIQVTDSSPTTVSSSPLTLTVAPILTISTTSPLPQGELTVPYSQTLTASGGSGSGLTWTLASGTLPAGLSLVGNAITGTPTAATSSPATFTIRVTDSLGGVASLAFTLNITSGPSISTTSLPNGEVTAPYSQTLAATGGSGSGYSFSVSSGSPPIGLSLNAAGSITGTPSATGPFTFTVQVTDSAGGKGTQSFTLTVVAAPTITTGATLPNGEVGAAYSQTLAASGGSGTGYTWSLAGGSSLPAGLFLSAGGVLSGTPAPAALGTASFSVQVTDSANGTSTLVMSLTIIAGPTITTAPALPNGTVGVAYTTVTLSASEGTLPYVWSIVKNSLPPGLSLDPIAGTISGSPTASSASSFTVQVKDAKNVTATKLFSITIAAGLTITTAPGLPSGTIGVGYSVTLAAAGGTPPYTFSATSGSLPAGLTLNSSTGEIRGTPSSSGSFSLTVQVTDSASVTATKAFTLTVAGALAFTTPPTLPSGAVGVAYSQALVASGGTPPYTFSITAGALPNGLGLSAVSNLITGTPVSSGIFTFTIRVKDSNSVTFSQAFSLTIVAGLVITTPSPLPQGAVNSPYSQALAAAGGVAPYTWAIAEGTLPPGLSLSGRVIVGTPTANGASSFTIQVKDNAGASATKPFTLTIGAGLAITSPSTLPSGTLGQAYPAYTLAAVGGSKPYVWSVSAGAMPDGLSLSSGGVISGTPSKGGSFTFTLQVKDSTGATATQAFTLSIVPPAAPQVNVSGVPAAAAASQQISFGVSLASPYALDINGQITASFQPDAVAPATDPALQFSTGGLTANYTIPANSLNAVFSNSTQKIGLQTGTVSGTITLTFTLSAGVALPSFQNTIVISRSAPVIESVKLVRTSGDLEVHVVGFSPPRDLTEADLTFTAAPGSTLQTTTVTENISSVATAWFQSAASDQYGSLLMLVLPFTASAGSVDAVGSVSVVLKSAEGTSPSVSGAY